MLTAMIIMTLPRMSPTLEDTEKNTITYQENKSMAGAYKTSETEWFQGFTITTGPSCFALYNTQNLKNKLWGMW